MNGIIGNRYYNFMVAINMHNTRKSWKRDMPDTACRNQNFLMPKYTMLISILYHNVTLTVIVFFLLSRLPVVHIDKLSDVVARTQWSASTLPDQRIRIADILSCTINRYQDDHIVIKYSEKFSGLPYKMFLKNITTQKNRTYFK